MRAAVTYVKKVKEFFKDAPERFEEFEKRLRDYSEGKITREEIIQSLLLLVHSNSELLADLEHHLPEGYVVGEGGWLLEMSLDD